MYWSQQSLFLEFISLENLGLCACWIWILLLLLLLLILLLLLLFKIASRDISLDNTTQIIPKEWDFFDFIDFLGPTFTLSVNMVSELGVEM